VDSLYRRLLDFTRDGVYRYTFEDGVVLFANQGLVDILDLDCRAEALVGRPLTELLVYTEKEGTVRESLAKTGEIHGFEYHFKTRKGEDRWVLHDSFVTLDPASGERVVEAIVKDITARKLAEQELEKHGSLLAAEVAERTGELVEAGKSLRQEIEHRKRAGQRLEAALGMLAKSNRELQQFAYVASHDLQEPLRKIVAFGERLRRKAGRGLSEDAREDLERMQDAARRMQALISDLLLYSRVTTRGPEFASVDMNEVVRVVLSDLEPRIEETGARVEVGRLPVLDADEVRMRELMQNLISNAVKFHRDSVAPVVRVRSEASDPEAEDGGRCTLFVEDNGIGFEEGQAEQMFGVFQRLHGRGVYEGTGIGLAICRRIAESHGGTIRAAGRPGEGATFAVELPVSQGGDGEEAAGTGLVRG